MRVAYARVSTDEQSLDLQIDALKRAGYDELRYDHGVSGTSADRPGLQEALALLKEGDTLVVWRLDRLARSLRELTDLVWSLHNRNIGFHSLCEYIDVGSAFGEFTLHILSAVAHFERALIVERTKAGMQAARERGVQFGRPKALTCEQLQEAMFLIEQGMKPNAAASQMGIGRSTLYRHLANIQRQTEIENAV